MKTFRLAAAAATFLFLGCPSFRAPDWFTERGNLAHTAHNSEKIQLPLQVRWQIQLGGGVRASVIGAFGMLFVGANDKKMYALSPADGSVQWSYEAGGAISASATAVGENKSASKYLWFVADDGVLYALDAADGSMLWTLTGGVGTFNSATNYATGRVYYTYMNSGVTSRTRAVNGGTGAVVWESSSFNITTATPMHGGGLLMQGITQGGTVFKAFNPANGQVEWVVSGILTPTAGAYTSGALDYDVGLGNPVKIYMSGAASAVRALAATSGATIWEITLPGSGPVYGMALTQERNPNVLVVSQSTDLYALDPVNGSILWHSSHGPNLADPTTRRTPQPAIYGDYVFHIEGGNRLVARSLTSGNEIWSAALDASSVSSPTVGGNTVYIGTSSGSVYAFSPP